MTEVSEKLHYIGWNDFDLDDETMQINYSGL